MDYRLTHANLSRSVRGDSDRALPPARPGVSCPALASGKPKAKLAVSGKYAKYVFVSFCHQGCMERHRTSSNAGHQPRLNADKYRIKVGSYYCVCFVLISFETS